MRARLDGPFPTSIAEHPRGGRSVALLVTFLNPMSLAYSRKQRRHTIRPYLRMMPCVLLHTRLQPEQTRGSACQRAGGEVAAL